MKKLLVVVAMVCAVAGCASIPAPQSTSQTLAYSYGTVAAVRESAAAALQSGAITVAQAQQVLDLTDKARTALDDAEKLNSNQIGAQSPGLTADLQLVATLLQQAKALVPAK